MDESTETFLLSAAGVAILLMIFFGFVMPTLNADAEYSTRPYRDFLRDKHFDRCDGPYIESTCVNRTHICEVTAAPDAIGRNL